MLRSDLDSSELIISSGESKTGVNRELDRGHAYVEKKGREHAACW